MFTARKMEKSVFRVFFCPAKNDTGTADVSRTKSIGWAYGKFTDENTRNPPKKHDFIINFLEKKR